MARDITTLDTLTLESSVRRADWFITLRREAAESTDDMLVGLELDPPYQRTSVWDIEQRRRLLRSFLTGLPVPAVICNDRFAHGNFEASGGVRDWRTAVIDGKQRIETLLAWHDGTLSLPAAWFHSEDLADADSDYVTREDLTVPARRLLNSRLFLPVATATLATLRDEAALYLLLNEGGTAHTRQDLDRARALLA